MNLYSIEIITQAYYVIISIELASSGTRCCWVVPYALCHIYSVPIGYIIDLSGGTGKLTLKISVSNY